MFKEKLKEKLRENTLSVFVCCLILFIVCAIGSVVYNSKSKIEEIDYNDAEYQYESAEFRYGSSWKTEKQQELYDAELSYKAAKREYNKLIILRNIFYIGCALFFILSSIMIVLFFKNKYPTMSDEEKYYLKRSVFRIGLACAAVGLIVFTVILVYSLNELSSIDEQGTLEEAVLYGIYTLYIIISTSGLCVSATALLGYAFLFGLDFVLQKNALLFGLNFANQKKIPSAELSEIKKPLENDSITQ